MKLHPSLTRVTTFSKIIALFLFILLPLVGFKFGMDYQKMSDSLIQPLSTPVELKKPVDTALWNTYTNNEYGVTLKYPPDWVLETYSSGIVYVGPPETVVKEGIQEGLDMRRGLVTIIPDLTSANPWGVDLDTTIGVDNAIRARRSEEFTTRSTSPNPAFSNHHLINYITEFGSIHYAADIDQEDALYHETFQRIISTLQMFPVTTPVPPMPMNIERYPN